MPLTFEPLERRALLAVTAAFDNGALTVTGDSSANEISLTVAEVSGVPYIMIADGATTIFDGRPSGANVAAAHVSSLYVDAGDGDDLLDFAQVDLANGFSSFSQGVFFGGAGDDTIVGTGFADYLIGGAGNDTLGGGAGGMSIPSSTRTPAPIRSPSWPAVAATGSTSTHQPCPSPFPWPMPMNSGGETVSSRSPIPTSSKTSSGPPATTISISMGRITSPSDSTATT